MSLLKKHARSLSYLAASGVVFVSRIAHAQPDLGLQYGEYTGLGSRDIRIIIADVINIVLGLLGVFFVALLVVAGFRYLTSAGNADTNKKALGTITSAIIGLAIVLSAYVIARFVLQSLMSATTGIVN